MRNLTFITFFMLFFAIVVSFKFKFYNPFYSVKYYYKKPIIATKAPIQITTKRPVATLPSESLQFCREWEKRFKKKYASLAEEELACKKVLENKRAIDIHNQKVQANGFEVGVSFTRGLWRFSDLDEEEKRNTLLGLIPPDPAEEEISCFEPTGDYIQQPDEDGNEGRQNTIPLFLNLTSKVGPVRNQNGCNSCWAFSTDYITEYVARKRSSSSKLVGAPQQLLDCCTTCGSCNGGRVKASLDYLKSAGVANESVYPYQGVVGSCSYNNLTQKAGFINTTGIVFLYGNETKLREIVATFGVVSVAICVEKDFFNYASGVYYNPTCCTSLQHAITIVGYGTDPTQGDYWIAMNTWGGSWGERGTVRFARNRGNMCNIAYYAAYAS